MESIQAAGTALLVMNVTRCTLPAGSLCHYTRLVQNALNLVKIVFRLKQCGTWQALERLVKRDKEEERGASFSRRWQKMNNGLFRLDIFKLQS